jgi:hypothetical protein
MRVYTLTILFIALFISVAANAAVERRSLDLKLPTQGLFEQQTISAPGASTNSGILTNHAGPTSAAALTVSTFLGQPDVPRALRIVPGGTTADVAGCTVVVNGTDIHNDAISESIVIADNQATVADGVKAFKTVTSLAFPANCEEGGFAATWSMGYINKLGLSRCMADAAHFVQAGYGGAFESTRPTVAANASAVSSNTILLNTALAGSSVQALFIQNFACLP